MTINTSVERVRLRFLSRFSPFLFREALCLWFRLRPQLLDLRLAQCWNEETEGLLNKLEFIRSSC